MYVYLYVYLVRHLYVYEAIHMYVCQVIHMYVSVLLNTCIHGEYTCTPRSTCMCMHYMYQLGNCGYAPIRAYTCVHVCRRNIHMYNLIYMHMYARIYKYVCIFEGVGSRVPARHSRFRQRILTIRA